MEEIRAEAALETDTAKMTTQFSPRSPLSIHSAHREVDIARESASQALQVDSCSQICECDSPDIECSQICRSVSP